MSQAKSNLSRIRFEPIESTILLANARWTSSLSRHVCGDQRHLVCRDVMVQMSRYSCQSAPMVNEVYLLP